jgi:hypothetical protein
MSDDSTSAPAYELVRYDEENREDVVAGSDSSSFSNQSASRSNLTANQHRQLASLGLI